MPDASVIGRDPPTIYRALRARNAGLRDDAPLEAMIGARLQTVARSPMSAITRRLKLPHPELERLVDTIKTAVTGERTCLLDGVEIRYFVCDPWPDEADLAMYDEDAKIFLPESFALRHPDRARLVAIHEHVETANKLAGRSRAYAHRRAILIELLAAKAVFDGPDRLRGYLKWRIGAYPDWKVPDKPGVVAQLHDLLLAVRPLRGRILDAVKAAKL